jgi:hypothetical protein
MQIADAPASSSSSSNKPSSSKVSLAVCCISKQLIYQKKEKGTYQLTISPNKLLLELT